MDQKQAIPAAAADDARVVADDVGRSQWRANDVLGVPDVARELGIGERRVRDLIEAGRLHAGRIGRGTWYVRYRDLDSVRVRPAGRPRSGSGAKTTSDENKSL